jgi:2-dehydrotetronate isomerase
MPRFAANLTMMFNEHAFIDRFKAAADAGFDAVEFLFPYEFAPDEIARALDRNGLTLALFNLPPGDWNAGERGIASLPDRQAEFRTGLATALSYAHETGVGRLHMLAGIADHADPDARARYLDALKAAADAAGPHGIDILVEPINSRDMPGYFLNGFPLAADLIAASGRDNVRLQFDIYHRQIMAGDVTRALEGMIDRVGHIQTASVPGRHEPGSGELDDDRLFALIDRLGYDGFVGCEYRPAAGTAEGLDWFRKWRRRRGRPAR